MKRWRLGLLLAVMAALAAVAVVRWQGRRASTVTEVLAQAVSNSDMALSASASPTVGTNPHLAKVDAAITDVAERDAIRAAQPATARIGDGGAVCVGPRGDFLTAAHVVGRLGSRTLIFLPDGTRLAGTCVALNAGLDVAIVRAETTHALPYVKLAPASPRVGQRVVCIGSPAEASARGEPTGYSPFWVSTGAITAIEHDRLAGGELGGITHDAWTYWGHSGAPLLDTRGRLVGMHNSWDEFNGARHAVTHEAIVKVLEEARVPFEFDRDPAEASED